MTGVGLADEPPPWYYSFNGYLPSTDEHVYSRENNTNEPYPAIYWGNGDAPNMRDRQSVITHELGHVIKLQHPGLIRSGDPQTMLSYYTSTAMRTPNGDDNFALKKLYPAP